MKEMNVGFGDSIEAGDVRPDIITRIGSQEIGVGEG